MKPKGRSAITYPARIVRRSLRRLAQLLRYQRTSLSGVPILFANSFPKSGTHLLTQVLQSFTEIGPAVDAGLPAVVTYDSVTGHQRPAEDILGDLRRLRPGDIAYGHLHATPEAVEFLSQPGAATYFILRDPRDVVVSHVHYITEMEPGHIHHHYYKDVLKSFDDRLCASIQGLTDPQIPFPDIRGRFEPFLGWLDCPEVLALRYEEFITDRDKALGRTLDHALARGFPLAVKRTEALQILSAGIDPQRSPTFRSGKIGGWRERFTEEHKRLFKAVAGDLLVSLGYERDCNW